VLENDAGASIAKHGPVPGEPYGNADINATVGLPSPCIAPSCSWPRPPAP